MKKYFTIFAILAAAVIILPQEVKAQWTNPYENYRMNDLIRRTPKKKTVRKSDGKRKYVRRSKTPKKVVPRKARRVSKRMDMANPGFEFVLKFSKRSDVVL